MTGKAASDSPVLKLVQSRRAPLLTTLSSSLGRSGFDAEAASSLGADMQRRLGTAHVLVASAHVDSASLAASSLAAFLLHVAA